MSDKQTTSKGFAILSLAGIINKFLAVAYVSIQTMLVGNYGNGIINAGYNIYIFIYALSNAGIPVAISKLISERSALGDYKGSKKILRIAGLILVCFGVFFCSMMLLGAGWISNQISQPKAKLMLMALAPTLLFTSISALFRGYFQGRQNMTPTALSQVIEQALNSILTIVFVALLVKYGVSMAAAGSTIGTSMGALGAAMFLAFLFFRSRKKRLEEMESSNYDGPQITDKEVLKQILSYCLPAILGMVAVNASNIIDLKFGVSRMIDGGISSVHATALYGILTTQYQKVLNLPLAVTAALPAALIPAISYAKASNNLSMLYHKINESFKVILMITIPSAFGLAVLAKPIITLVIFSTKQNQGADLMQIGSWVMIAMAVIYVQTATLLGVGKALIPPVNMMIGMIFKLAINYFLIAVPSINVKGAVIGTTAGFVITCVLNQIAIKKHTGISVKYVSLVYRPLIASAVMSAAAFGLYVLSDRLLSGIIKSSLLLNDVSLFIAIAAGAGLYAVILLYTKAVEATDIRKLPMGNKISNFLVRRNILKVN
ncbi:MAG TPA: polysaccharide biosynthesis protein [Ruminiclostridium sp.]|nr:polysaccharide biosynthesis protein [Ruminiclostridium sp.]